MLDNEDLRKLNVLIPKLSSKSATAVEMREFLALIENSGGQNWSETQRYLQTSGYASVDDFKKHIDEKLREELIDGLVKIGLAILVAYGLSQLLKKNGN